MFYGFNGKKGKDGRKDGSRGNIVESSDSSSTDILDDYLYSFGIEIK